MSLRLEGPTTNRRADLAPPTGQRLDRLRRRASASALSARRDLGSGLSGARDAGRVDLGDLGSERRQFLTATTTRNR